MTLINEVLGAEFLSISEAFLENFFLLLLIFISSVIAVSRNLLNIVVLSGVFSLIIAVLYLLMAAPDVAMTEAAIGACIATAFVIKTMQITSSNIINQKLVTFYNIVSFFIIIIFGEIVIYSFIDLPEYGQTFNPVNNYLSKYYLANTKGEIGIASSVAAILASYRGFDTLGETLVIVVAGIVVYFVLNEEVQNSSELSSHKGGVIYQNKLWMTDYIRVILLPISLIFAFYVQVHGEISPGGGFQAGAIVASLYIFFYIVSSNNLQNLNKTIRFLFKFSLVGFLIYLLMAIYTALLGGYFLEYKAITGSILGHQIGIFIIEIGVGISVFSVLLMIFLLFERQVQNLKRPR